MCTGAVKHHPQGHQSLWKLNKQQRSKRGFGFGGGGGGVTTLGKLLYRARGKEYFLYTHQQCGTQV
jgi:hypothetical protein